jgi:hypothetical protein
LKKRLGDTTVIMSGKTKTLAALGGWLVISFAFPCAAQPLEIAALPGQNDTGWLRNWLAAPRPGQPPPSQSPPAARTTQAPSPQVLSPQYRRRQPAASDTQPVQPNWRRPRSLVNDEEPRRVALPGISLTIGTTMTSGNTTWNHDASNASASLGNPTSELTYSETVDVALEAGAEARLPNGLFARANIGIGIATLRDGRQRDDDFLAGQSLSSSTESVIPDTDLFYISADIGKRLHTSGDFTVDAFAGFQYWREKQEAYGVYNLLTDSQTRSDDELVLTNEVEWTSLRLGFIGDMQINQRSSLAFELAVIPFSIMHNEDTHHLRTSSSDLGPAPNIVMDGFGFGFEGNIAYNYRLSQRLSAVLDFRYWQLMSDGDVVFGPDSNSPSTFKLNDLETFRYGAGLSLRYLL